MADDRKGFYRSSDDILQIPAKANRILNVVLAGMLLIVFRVWHLAVVQYDEKLDESRRPQRHFISEPAKRATIRDRFNIPLAINKVQYNVAILYSQIKQIPTAVWETNSGKRIKRYKRKEYIAALAQMLGKELSMDPDRIEDLIHAKASFYNQIPFVLKQGIQEKEYYRLKMLEKDWLGLAVQRVPKRHYTQGKVAADIIGYMGAINGQEYETIIREIKGLEAYVEAIDSGEMLQLPEGMTSMDYVRKRLKDLHELAYSVNDSIGKAGIENRFENELRGFRGKKSFYSDARGKFLRELPGTREPLPGKRILLTISSELQEYAERLLIQNESIRQTRLSHLDAIKHTILADKEPWIKGGAIVAMDPNNGEILAMASHPRIDPNDFIASGETEERKRKMTNAQHWLENEAYLANIWNQSQPMERELYEAKQGVFLEQKKLTWSNYLELVLSKSSALKSNALLEGTVRDAVMIQRHVEVLLALNPQKNTYQLFNILYRSDDHLPHGKKLISFELETIERQLIALKEQIEPHKQALNGYIGNLKRTYDQVLLIDLLRVAVDHTRFNDELLVAVGQQTLSEYRDISAAFVQLHEVVKKMTRELFHEVDFREWRKSNEKEYLKKIRAEEKAAHRYARPYIDYLDNLENEMFNAFWEKHQWNIIIAMLIPNPVLAIDNGTAPYVEHFQSWEKEIANGAHQSNEWSEAYHLLHEALSPLSHQLAIKYLQSMRGYHALERPLLGSYRYLRKNSDKEQQEKHLAAAFYPKYGYGYGRSQGYRQAATQGSLFKLVTAYEALVQSFKQLEEEGKSLADLNPLEMVDLVYHKGKDQYLGYDANKQPLPRYYKGGRLPRSAMPAIGSLDLLKALETSSNPYFAILAGDVLKSPNDLVAAAKLFSYGAKTGIDLPWEISGRVPNDLETNRTGLYSFSIGQHTLVVTPLQTSIMLSTLANGGKVLRPKIVQMMVGKDPWRGQDLVSGNHYFPFEEELSIVGIDFPLFIEADADHQKSLIKRFPTDIKREIFLPNGIQLLLLDGMCKVVERTHGESLKSLSRLYRTAPEAIQDYIELKHLLLGKTSTSESVENIDLDLETGTNMYTHVWFGGIVYDEEVVDKKEHRFLFRDSFGRPELVVVVYLKYGGYGKEAGPIAAQVAKKWKEIKQERSKPLPCPCPCPFPMSLKIKKNIDDEFG